MAESKSCVGKIVAESKSCVGIHSFDRVKKKLRGHSLLPRVKKLRGHNHFVTESKDLCGHSLWPNQKAAWE